MIVSLPQNLALLYKKRKMKLNTCTTFSFILFQGSSLDEIYRPIGVAFPNNSTRRQRLVGSVHEGLSPTPPRRGLRPVRC
ncbi:hypothetical protein L6452_16268 [Arctium lappa]|uniref:Uncharacterized protein n=1 Tax=Arctium lappa TaxID=4217 RepID=A0ACB9C0A3_ARCLA|nr:hypothetical protein L6452_16268 [Arctium lappa]